MEVNSLDSRTHGIAQIPTRAPGGGRASKFDNRTHATRYLTGLIADVERELLGDRRDQLGVLERACVEGFAGVAMQMENLNARLARGESIDITEHARVCDVMLRLASHLGLKGHTKGDEL
jgi:hypothetical protein